MHIDRRLLGLARGHSVPLLGAVGLGAVGGVVIVIQAWLLAHIVAEVFLAGAGREQLATPLFLLLIALTLRAFFSWCADSSAARAAAGVKHELRCRVFARLLERGPVAAERERTGELVATLTDGIEALDAYVASYLPQLALSAVIPFTIAVVVLSRDLLTALVLLLTAPLIPLFMVLIGRLANAKARRQWVDMARLSAFFLDTIQGLTTLKLLGRSRDQVAEIRRVSQAFKTSSMRVLRIAFLSALVLELVTTLSVAVVAVQIGLRLLHGRVGFEEAFFVLLLAPEFYLPLRRLGAQFHAGLAGATAAERLFGLLEGGEPPSHAYPSRPIPATPSLALEHVSFTYPADEAHPGDRPPALDNVSLRIEKAEMVALVGPNGAGKSTLAKVLMRFADPDGGQVTVDGVDAAAIDPRQWRRAVTWVPQRPYLFADTIEANIRFGRPGAQDEDVDRAVLRARAEDFISALPLGLRTHIGERGVTLSGGQAQRIALARAFLVDAPILILDEPAEDLDPRLRAELDRSLEDLLVGRTAVIIAHRLPTVIGADRIVVLDGGRVVDQGSHGELLDRCDLYRRLATSYGGAP